MLYWTQLCNVFDSFDVLYIAEISDTMYVRKCIPLLLLRETELSHPSDKNTFVWQFESLLYRPVVSVTRLFSCSKMSIIAVVRAKEYI